MNMPPDVRCNSASGGKEKRISNADTEIIVVGIGSKILNTYSLQTTYILLFAERYGFILLHREPAEQAGRAKGWRPAQAGRAGILKQRDLIERSEIEVRCPRGEAPQPPRDDNINDGTEDTNHNGRIDGDNGDGIYTDDEPWKETSPNLKDSDGDLFEDYQEISWEYNPISRDTDNDGLLDNEEDLTDSGTRGVLDSGETDPTKSDTDNDGLSDLQENEGWEIVIYYESTGEKIENYTAYSDPTVSDSDYDGLDDMAEFQNQTDPTEVDTDGDGINDYYEITCNISSSPTGVDGQPPEIWDFDICYKGSDYVGRGKLKIPTKLVVSVSVGTRDLFGIRSIYVDIHGLENKKVDTNNVRNVSHEFEWTISGLSKIKRAAWDGFEINVSVTDRNNNVGFKTDKLDSIKDIAVSAFIGALISIAQFLSSLLDMLMDLIQSIIENIFTKALNVFVDAIGLVAEPALEMIVDLAGVIFSFDTGESTKYSDPEGESDTGWELSIYEAVSIMDLIFSIHLLGAAAITGIMIAYVAGVAAASAVSAGSAKGAVSFVDKIIYIVAPVVLYSILGALGVSLAITSGFSMLDGYLPDSAVKSLFETMGVASDIAEGITSAIEMIAKVLSTAAVSGWQVKAAANFIQTGNNGIIFLMGIMSLSLTLLLKTGRFWTPQTPWEELGVSCILAIFAFISLLLWFKTTLSPQKQVWKEIYAPVETIMDLMCVGFCTATIGSFFNDLFHYAGDRYPWD